MGLLVYLALLVTLCGQAYSDYLALAPSEFHPGWKYQVQISVSNVPNNQQVMVNANIFNSQKTSVGAGNVNLNNGETKKLEIQLGANIAPDSYTLQLDGSGGLTFTNSTTVRLAPLTHLTFIQTDKKIYKAGQLIRFRVMVVDKDLIPQKIAKNITIENPAGSTLAKFAADGTKAVYENTYQLTEFPDLGGWKIKVVSRDMNIEEEIMFTVDEYVLPKFEVTAEVTPSYLLVGSKQTQIMVGVTAKYTYGKGVMGDVKVTVMNARMDASQTINSKIQDPSGKKDVEIDLASELSSANQWDSFTIKVEVTDETQRTYETTTTVRIESKPVKIEFDQARTDMVFRPGMPIRAVVKLTDPDNKPLESSFLENDLVLTLNDPMSRSPITQNIPLSAGQTEVEYTFQDVPSASSYTLKASLTVNDVTYSPSDLYLNKYETLGNATLDARWTSDQGMLMIGGTVQFMVDVSDPSHYQGDLMYMIVSRGNVQEFGTVSPGQTKNIRVTTNMCPQGRLVVYGITAVSAVSTVPEVIADSLELKLEHCQDKKVTPSASPSGSVRTGTNTTLTMEVAWTDASKMMPVGQHDIYMLAVDKSIILLEGDNDITPKKVEEELERFNLGGSGGGRPQPLERGKRSFFPGPFPMPNPSPKSTGELFQEEELRVMSDMVVYERYIPQHSYMDDKMFAMGPPVAGEAMAAAELAPDQNGEGAAMGGMGGGVAPAQVTVRKDFPDTWIWNSAQTDASGRVSVMEKLPDTITSWVISAFAVRDDSELGVTAQPLELNAFNPFFVSLNLPYSIRRTEKFELRATVFNYESGDLDTVVTLAESNDYTIAGGAVKTTMVKANSASSVTFMIVASTVGVINLKVTATAQRANSVPITDVLEKKLIVRPEGVERMRAITFPVFVPETGEYNQNFTLDFSPWTLADVVEDSRRAAVKITGDMMGNALEDIDKLVTMPTGCGEQNMITTVPNIYAWAYLEAVNDLSADFKVKASEYMKQGYTKETQQYRWDTGSNAGGYSAFGTSDQAASTWLTAFVLRSFAQAKNYIPETVDVDLLDTAVEFLFRRQSPDGLFYELGKVIHDDMQGGTGAGDALSVYILICMLEAKKHGVEIDANKLTKATNYVNTLSNGEEVKERQFLAAITAYALALENPTNAMTQAKVEQLIRYVDEKEGGAPWRKQKESATVKPEDSFYYHPPPGPSDIEVTAYCILAYSTIGRVAEGRDLVLWLQKQQNSNGGYRSTQDTVMALQAISVYAAIFSKSSGVPTANVEVTTLSPAGSPQTVTINSGNSKLLQRVELPDETNKVNIRVTGTPKSLAVVKVVWNFYTAPETEEKPPSETGAMDNNSKKLKVTTESKMLRPGFHNVEACVKPEAGLEYDNMMVMTLDMPSGFVPEDLQKARTQSPNVVRVEQDKDQLHLYMSQPREECVNVVMEQTVMVENLKPGTAALYAYYDPDIKSEAPIALAVSVCEGDDCDPAGHASSQATLSRLLLAACLCLLMSLCLAL